MIDNDVISMVQSDYFRARERKLDFILSLAFDTESGRKSSRSMNSAGALTVLTRMQKARPEVYKKTRLVQCDPGQRRPTRVLDAIRMPMTPHASRHRGLGGPCDYGRSGLLRPVTRREPPTLIAQKACMPLLEELGASLCILT